MNKLQELEKIYDEIYQNVMCNEKMVIVPIDYYRFEWISFMKIGNGVCIENNPISIEKLETVSFKEFEFVLNYILPYHYEHYIKNERSK
jgi:hypothetical protein